MEKIANATTSASTAVKALADKGIKGGATLPVAELTKALEAIVGIAAAGGAYKLIGAAKDALERRSVRNHIVDMGKSFSTDADPFFKDNAQKAKARLYEIARVAPHVTMNTDITRSLIRSKIDTGLSDDDKLKLTFLQSQYHASPETGSYMPKLAGEIMADVVMIKESAMNMDGLKSVAKYVGALSLLPLTTGIVGGLVNKGSSMMAQRDLKQGLEESFMKAMSLSDKDKEPLHQNKQKARDAFSTLVRFAPNVALDPQAARSFMNKIVSYDTLDMSTVKELSEINKNLSQSQGPTPFATGFSVVSTMTGAPNVLAQGMGGMSTSLARAVSPMGTSAEKK